MTDIPEDVMKLAQAAQDAAMAECKAEKFAVYEYPFGTGRAKDVLDAAIARAILAERERCANVCKAVGSDADPQLADHIAAAIRRPA